MAIPHVVILGGGPAGLGAALQLARRRLARVTLLERGDRFGGNAGSFQLEGQWLDYGSHRLHPACDPTVLQDIRSLLGDDLLERPRHGRILLRGRWIHFPLKPLDLALRLPPPFAAGVAADVVAKGLRLLRRRSGGAQGGEPETFATVLEAGLGRTICRDFYFPYAQKLWGVQPDTLAAEQARRRVAAGSLGKMARKVLASVPGLKPAGAGRFYYPRRGFGQIATAYATAAHQAGADLRLGANLSAVTAHDFGGFTVHFEQGGAAVALDADYVWSTIPITALAGMLRPALPAAVLEATEDVRFRAMILVYLVLETDRFTEFDAHYFPGLDIPISRLSEPKNYSAGNGPAGQTVLCAEIPCLPGDAVWRASDEDLGRLVQGALASAGLPVQARVRRLLSRRLAHAYPIYHQGYEARFRAVDEAVGAIDGLLTFGRQGLFAHDNTHHALHMAYCAVDCLDGDGGFDPGRWQTYRRAFETHLVED